MTGETARRPVAAGASIHAGSLNFSGALTVRVTAAGSDTLIAEVERLLSRRPRSSPRYLRLADRAAATMHPSSTLRRPLTAAGWLLAGASLHDAVVTAIAVLIITCPCAPRSPFRGPGVASGALFRSGVILNSGDAIGRLADRHHRFRQDRHPHLPEPRVDNAAGIEPTCFRWPHGWRYRAITRSPQRSRAKPATDARSRARSKRTGKVFVP